MDTSEMEALGLLEPGLEEVSSPTPHATVEQAALY